MIYKDDENPFDMNLLTNIAEHFQSVRPKYVQYEGSMRGVDINMLISSTWRYVKYFRKTVS